MGLSVVTGANGGIGFELCRQLAERGGDVVAVCRSSNADLDALDVRVESGCDVTSDADVDALAASFAGASIDLVINNAGILRNQTLEQMDFDSIRNQFEVNALGPLRVTHALLPQLHAGSKIALITSRMGSLADNTSGRSYGYRMSKAALNVAGISLAHDLRERGVSVAILHPGYVRTSMTARRGNVEAHESAAGLLARVDELTLKNSGTFLHMNGETLPW
jgi:NAD(P)-dependent dehydrogenase (short-subunit alcohol dehydrogenase family)